MRTSRETWARTATAEVTIVDAAALPEAAAQAKENAVTIGLHADPDVEDAEPEAPTRGGPPVTRSTLWVG